MAKTIAYVLTRPKFLAWVKTQPPAHEFDYTSTGKCAVAWYLKAQGFQGVIVAPTMVWPAGGPANVPIPRTISEPMRRMTKAATRFYTFGTLAAYLESRA